MQAICPGCGNAKSKRAALCADCRRQANALGLQVLTAVATPSSPTIPRTPAQNKMLHGRLREIATLEKPGIERDALWTAERKLKRWAVAMASRLVGKPFSSSTELSELEMERLLDWLGDVIDDMRAGGKRPHPRAA